MAVLGSYERDREALKKYLSAMIVKEQGYESELAHVFFLEEIGLVDVPVNATGKVVKRELAEAVERHLAHRG